MKWLFATLLGLNVIVFAGMIAGKMLKEFKPASPPVGMVQPTQVFVNTSDFQDKSASNVVVTKGSPATIANTTSNNTQPKTTHKASVVVEKRPQAAQVQRSEPVVQPKANYKNCSARVSMPEDDYHRIKGLLSKYPHAASRQVVEGGENGAQSSSRMNVLFMSVSDQDAGAIQAVVGRYGQLNRAPCNK